MAQIDRSGAAALIDIQQTQQIWQEAAQYSLALRTFNKVNMGTSQVRMRLLDALPSAGFVGNQGDGGTSGAGRKPTSNAQWANKIMQAEEIAVIIPVPENVLADVEFDLWAQLRPLIAQAVGSTLDAAVFFGVGANYPSSWPTGGLKGNAVAAGNVISRSAAEGRAIGTGTAVVATDVITTSAAHGLSVGNAVVLGGGGTVTGFSAGQTYYVLTVPSSTTLTLSATPGGSTLNLTGSDGSVGSVAQVGVNGVPVVPGQDLGFTVASAMSLVEDDGFTPTQVWAHRRLNQAFRVLRDANGQLLYLPNYTADRTQAGASGSLWGMNVDVAQNDAFEAGNAGTTLAIVGDAQKAILGLRQDMEMKLLDQAVLTDGAGNIIYSLAEQDMVALRVKVRYGFQIADPTTLLGGASASPFAVINA